MSGNFYRVGVMMYKVKISICIIFIFIVAIAEYPMKRITYSISNPFRGFSNKLTISTMGKVDIYQENMIRGKVKCKSKSKKLDPVDLKTFVSLVDSLIDEQINPLSCSSIPPKDAPRVSLILEKSENHKTIELYNEKCDLAEVNFSVQMLLKFLQYQW